MTKTINKKTAAFWGGLFACHGATLEPIKQLITESGISEYIRFEDHEHAYPDNAGCNLDIAVFGKTCDIDQYEHFIAKHEAANPKSIVLSFVREEDKALLKSSLLTRSADDLIIFPLSAEQFFKIIITRLVMIEIGRSIEHIRPAFSRRDPSIGEFLKKNNLIDPLQLKDALDQQRNSDKRLLDIFVERGSISEKQRVDFLSSQLDIPLATGLQYASASSNVVAIIPEYVARRYMCIALEKQGRLLSVAMNHLDDLRMLDNLRDLTELTIKPMLGESGDITTSIDRYYRDIASSKDAREVTSDLSDSFEFIQETEETESIEEITEGSADSGIIKLVNMLIVNAVHDRASDIHIEPQEKELVIRYRVDGDLRHVMSTPRQSHLPIVTRIKIVSNLDIAERRLPQDGRMAVRIGKHDVDIRVSILPTVYGEKVVLRLLDKEAFNKSVNNLGFSQHELKIFESQITKPYGMIIVTGPTGSGKSTTLYSALQQVKDVHCNIITVEDPVEFHIDGITQVPVNAKIGLTFGQALRSILRQDPDIVLIGEIRDEETADIAIKMSITGHVVFSTMHTNDAASAISRFVDLSIPPLLLASSLNLVVAQRLVRRVCAKCKKEYEPDPELLEQLKLPQQGAARFYRGEGCVTCNGTGFKGRTGLFEMLAVSREIRSLILKNAPTMEIQAQAEKEGMKTMRTAGIERALNGDTTIEEVYAETMSI